VRAAASTGRDEFRIGPLCCGIVLYIRKEHRLHGFPSLLIVTRNRAAHGPCPGGHTD
jgi:hypothetical protein